MRLKYMQGNLFPVFDAAVTKTDYNTVSVLLAKTRWRHGT